jgi:hypothetical protein
MKTARIALLVVMMLALAACTERQRRVMMSGAANALLASLLDLQSSAPLTQSSFHEPRVAVANDAEDSQVPPEPEVEETDAPRACPLAPLPFASTNLNDIAAHAAGVADAKSTRKLELAVQSLSRARVKLDAIARCKEIRILQEKGKQHIVVRAEYTVPGDSIIVTGLDDLAL